MPTIGCIQLNSNAVKLCVIIIKYRYDKRLKPFKHVRHKTYFNRCCVLNSSNDACLDTYYAGRAFHKQVKNTIQGAKT